MQGPGAFSDGRIARRNMSPKEHDMEENPVARACEPAVRLAAILAGYALLGLSFLVAFEVVARKLFAFSLQGVDEIGGYVLAIALAFGVSHTLLHRAHTRIDIFIGALPRRSQPAFHALAFVALAGFAVFMAWRAASALGESLEYQSIASTPLQTPLWIPQSIWVFGLVVFAALACAFAVHAMLLVFRRPDRVIALYGPRTVEEEIEEGLAALDGPPGEATGETPGKTGRETGR